MKNDLEHQILYILQYKSSLYWDISVFISLLFQALSCLLFMLLFTLDRVLALFYY